MKIIIEVDTNMDSVIEKNAKEKNLTVPKYIEQVLNRYIVPVHIMEQEDVKEGYKFCSSINLDWANL